jgi:hypothetical protein
MEHLPQRNKNRLQKPQHRNYLGVIFIIVKPKMIDDCTSRWGGIFWSNTREFLEQTNNYNQATGCTVRGLNPGGGKIHFSLLRNAQIDSGENPVFYLMGTGVLFQQ